MVSDHIRNIPMSNEKRFDIDLVITFLPAYDIE